MRASAASKSISSTTKPLASPALSTTLRRPKRTHVPRNTRPSSGFCRAMISSLQMASTTSRASGISSTAKPKPCKHRAAWLVYSTLHHATRTLIAPELHVGTQPERCREHNVKDKEKGEAYDDEDFDNLIFRYEEPNGMARWDSPLFIVVEEDPTPPNDQIWDALIGSDGRAKLVKANLATVLVRMSSLTTYFFRLHG